MNKEKALQLIEILNSNQSNITRDKNHIYHLDGKPIEFYSVSKILEREELYNSILAYENGEAKYIKTPFSLYAGVKRIAKKATAGTEIHDLVDKKTVSDNTAAQQVNSFLSSRVHMNETKIFDVELKVVGEFDGLYFNEETQKVIVFDIKTGRMVNLVKFNNQLKQYITIICNNKDVIAAGITPKDFGYAIFKMDKEDNGDYKMNLNLFKEISFGVKAFEKTKEKLNLTTSESVAKEIALFFEKYDVSKKELEAKSNEILNEVTIDLLEDMCKIKENEESEIEAIKGSALNKLYSTGMYKNALTEKLQKDCEDYGDIISVIDLHKIVCKHLEDKVLKEMKESFVVQGQTQNLALTGKLGKGYTSEPKFYENIVETIKNNLLNPYTDIHEIFTKADFDKCKSNATTNSKKIEIEMIK